MTEPTRAAPPRPTPPPGEKPHGLPPPRRLRRTGDFTRTERQGRRVQGAYVVVVMRPGRGRVGFTVSKKVGNAVARNFVKRRLRDIARRHKELWARKDLVVIARPDAAGRELAALESDWLAAMKKLEETPLRRDDKPNDGRGGTGRRSGPGGASSTSSASGPRDALRPGAGPRHNDDHDRRTDTRSKHGQAPEDRTDPAKR